MILNWADGAYTDREKLIGAIWDAGVIRRSDLMLLLGWKRSKTDSHLLKLRQRDMLITSRDHHKETVYMLSESGIRAAHQLVGFEGKVVAMEHQISHQLGVNDIFLRYIRAYGCEGVRVYSTKEGSDELYNFRKNIGVTDAEWRSTMIRPDLLIRTPNSGVWWCEFDNATEGSRFLRKKLNLYVANLSNLDAKLRRVLWVAPTAERVRWLQAKWKDVYDNRLEMHFFTAGEETSFLAGEGVKDQQPV